MGLNLDHFHKLFVCNIICITYLSVSMVVGIFFEKLISFELNSIYWSISSFDITNNYHDTSVTKKIVNCCNKLNQIKGEIM